MQESIGDYLRHLKALRYAPKSIESFRCALSRFLLFATGRNIPRPADITARDLEAYRQELVRDGYTAFSISLYLRSVRNLFSYLEQERRIFINPAGGLVIPRVKERIRPVPGRRQVQALLEAPDIRTPTGIRDRAILETLYSTGVRLGELLGMNTCDPELAGGRIRVSGKGAKERVVPLGREAVLWTRQYLREVRTRFLEERSAERALWLGCGGRRIHPLIVSRLISAYGRQAGIGHPVTAHTLRRACATHMLEGGAHPVQIQMLLGHSDLRVLGHYLKVTVTDMKKTHAKAKPGR